MAGLDRAAPFAVGDAVEPVLPDRVDDHVADRIGLHPQVRDLAPAEPLGGGVEALAGLKPLGPVAAELVNAALDRTRAQDGDTDIVGGEIVADRLAQRDYRTV